jgi:hypothetical protein
MRRVAPALTAHPLNRKVPFRTAAPHRSALSAMDSGLGNAHNPC